MAVVVSPRSGARQKLWARASALLALRLLSLMLCLAPASAALHSGLVESIGRNPFADPQHELLDATLVAHGLTSLPGTWLGIALAGGLVFFLWDQLLTAAALVRLDPSIRTAPRVGLWRQLWDESARHFWPLLRIVIVAFVVLGVLATAVGKIVELVDIYAQQQAWTAQARFVELRGAQAGAMVLLTALVGSWAWLAKALTVLCNRRIVRRTLIDAGRIWWRTTAAWMLPFVLVTIAAQCLGGALLSALYPPSGSSAASVAWVGFLLVHGAVWLWIVRAAGAALTPDRRQRFGPQRDATEGWIERVVASVFARRRNDP